MTEQYIKYHGDISAISNELELSLKDATAPEVIAATRGELQIDPEVNRVDIVELLISMASDVDNLNERLSQDLPKLVSAVQEQGGQIYSGSSLIRDVSQLEPAWYRTTSLSYTLATNLLDIASQQIVIGIAPEGKNDSTGEDFGIQLYNTLRQVTPVILALSASSPYKLEDHKLIDTGYQSRRIEQYQKATSKLPTEILTTPSLKSVEDYDIRVQEISDNVNQMLARGELDCNTDELYKDRGGKSHAPFKTLEPHQIYWMVRPRPDHQNADSVFSLEVRVSDIPISCKKMMALNSFIMGLVYYSSRNGFENLDRILAYTGIKKDSPESIIPLLQSVAKTGLDTKICNNITIRQLVQRLIAYSVSGLQHRGIDTTAMTNELEKVSNLGNDATFIRAHINQNPGITPDELEYKLAQELSPQNNARK